MSDYDRSKFYGKKKFSGRDGSNFGSRFFNSKGSFSKDSEKQDNKPKSIKKTTILAREHHSEDRSASPKNIKDNEVTPSISIAVPPHADAVTQQHKQKDMTKCTKLLEDNVICSDNIQEYLLENDDYLVVGVIGTQGVGKSTILNLLSHDVVTEKLKKALFKYSENAKSSDSIRILSDNHVHSKNDENDAKIDDIIFKPQNNYDVINNCNRTTGIDFFITHNRVMFLDCQPFNSATLLDDFIAAEAKVSNVITDFLPLENTEEIYGLQLTAFLMSVCHVLILVQDWFLDSNIVRFIQTAEMLKPTISNPEDELIDHFPHLVLLHNKAPIEYFAPIKFKKIQEMYKSIFNKTKMHIESGMGIGTGRIFNSLSPENCGEPINLYLISEYDENTERLYKGHPSLENLIKNLRFNILGATKYPLSNTSEKHWLIYCSKVWDHIKKSNFFVEYSKLMP